jgi:predicted permease
LLVESLLLGTGGIAGGLALGWILLRAAIALSPDGLPRLSQASIDPRVTLAIATCGLLSAIGAGLWPALTGGRQDWRSGQRTTSQSTAWFRQVLIAFQIAASLTLLTGAGLLTRSLLQLQQVPLGLRTAGAYTTPLVMDRERYQLPGKRSSFIRQLEQLAVHTPGVAAAAVSDSIPPAGAAAAMIFSNIGLEGKAAIPQGTGGMVLHRFVSPGYFAALGIPILRGRAFVPQDSASGDVLIVNESAAAKMFPGEDALGKRVKLPQRGPWLSIVGISANARNNGLQGTSDPEYYEPWTDRSQTRAAHLTIRTPLGPAAAREILRTTVWQLDPTIPVEVQSLESRVDALRVQPRFQAAVLGFFALSGLVIAAVGLYGVISYLVARRTREIGVRLAVGASPGRILRMLLGQAAVWIGAGIGLGLMAAFFLGQVIEKLLFGVQPRDPATMAASALVLLTAAFTAIWLPARRAARLDPTLALGAD